jgi:hypothetical protein
MPRRRSPKRSSSGKKRISGNRRQARSYRYRAQRPSIAFENALIENEIALLENAIKHSGSSDDRISEMLATVERLRMHMAANTLTELKKDKN